MPVTADWSQLKAGDEIETFVRTTDLAHWNRYAAINDEFIPIHMDPADAQAVGTRRLRHGEPASRVSP